MNNDSSLKETTIRNMIWSFMDNIGSRVIQLGMQLFLARLLTPYDFGVLGMVTIFIVLSYVFIDGGFANGLIRDNKASQKDYSTVFFFNIIVALTVYILLYFSAGQISYFFEVPELVSVIRVLGIVIIINAFGFVQKTILTKNLQFNIKMKINIAASLISGIIAIGFALAGYGLWSLVVKMLVLELTQTIAYIFANRWKPSLVFSVSSFKRLFNFGWKLLAARLLTEIYANLYALIIGSGFSTTSLGFYSSAKKLSDTASYSIASSVDKVSYPVLSGLQNDELRLKNGFKKILKNSIFITFPVMLGLAVTAPAIFRILLGDSWLPSIPYFQILCFSGLFISLHANNLNILQVKGRSDLFLKVNVIEKIIGFIIIGCVLLLRLGIYGLLWGLVLDYFITYFIHASYSKKLIGYSILEQLRDIIKIFMISVIMATIAYSLNYIILDNDWLLIISQTTISFFVYFVLSSLFKIEELETIYQVAKPIQRRLIIKSNSIMRIK